MTSKRPAEQASVETVNAELGNFKSLVSDPTTLPSAKSTIVVGLALVLALASRASQ